MSLLKNPNLFSTHYKIDASKLNNAGLIDCLLNADTQLFIDPVLLEKSGYAIIKEQAYKTFCSHFENFVRLLKISQTEGDPAWKAAFRLIDLREPPETGLGYGGAGRSGSSRPEEIRTTIMRTSKQIISLGVNDPEMISLMGFFEENIGPDTISDFTTRVIVNQLAKLTEDFCKANKIKVVSFDDESPYKIPTFKDSRGKIRYVLLVPKDIVRDLPIARDWSEVDEAISANQKIRTRVNAFLGGIVSPTVAERKDAVKQAVLESADLFNSFLSSVKDFATHYDPNQDALGYYRLAGILTQNKDALKIDKKYSFSNGINEIVNLVKDTISIFKHHVENGNLWEELWMGDNPKRERAAQLIYYAIADSFCKANNVDISPEANMGGGPIDFKFSKGYHARVLVEMKRSSGTVVHGYEKQLEVYKKAAHSFHGIFVVMDFGDLGDKLTIIQSIQAARIAKGESASDIIVINARKKQSASKRK